MSSHEIIKSLDLWLSSFSEETTTNICSLYDEHASLWGTLSPIKRDTPALIENYFFHIFKWPNRRVSVMDSTIRLYGNIAICNGIYKFRWSDGASKVKMLARFSFVYTKKKGRWFIIEHHSSSLPLVT